ncbi:hypothetical protein NP493_722g02020 [Ridgeia piscesae]|uniref:Uncharacterized protein n=1 Tax=Ridgeia piscesae TaxID=27915 RepID=A0AAD9NNW3_RIDPI|nr:hypothetical protein NP493_722g02020 [Ridgeia piscesae]
MAGSQTPDATHSQMTSSAVDTQFVSLGDVVTSPTEITSDTQPSGKQATLSFSGHVDVSDSYTVGSRETSPHTPSGLHLQSVRRNAVTFNQSEAFSVSHGEITTPIPAVTPTSSSFIYPSTTAIIPSPTITSDVVAPSIVNATDRQTSEQNGSSSVAVSGMAVFFTTLISASAGHEITHSLPLVPPARWNMSSLRLSTPQPSVLSQSPTTPLFKSDGWYFPATDTASIPYQPSVSSAATRETWNSLSPSASTISPTVQVVSSASATVQPVTDATFNDETTAANSNVETTTTKTIATTLPPTYRPIRNSTTAVPIVKPDVSTRPFRTVMETKLAMLYHAAFERLAQWMRGEWIRRVKRAVSYRNVTVQMVNITRCADKLWQTDLVYYVVRDDNITAADDVVNAMALFNDQEVALMLGHVVAYDVVRPELVAEDEVKRKTYRRLGNGSPELEGMYAEDDGSSPSHRRHRDTHRRADDRGRRGKLTGSLRNRRSMSGSRQRRRIDEAADWVSYESQTSVVTDRTDERKPLARATDKGQKMPRNGRIRHRYKSGDSPEAKGGDDQTLSDSERTPIESYSTDHHTSTKDQIQSYTNITDEGGHIPKETKNTAPMMTIRSLKQLVNSAFS